MNEKQQAKITQKENDIFKEMTVLNYNIKKLCDLISELNTKLSQTKVIQVPYPVYPPQPSNPAPYNPPYRIGDPVPGTTPTIYGQNNKPLNTQS